MKAPSPPVVLVLIVVALADAGYRRFIRRKVREAYGVIVRRDVSLEA